MRGLNKRFNLKDYANSLTNNCSVPDALLLENDQQGVGSRHKEVAEGRQQEEEELIRPNLQNPPKPSKPSPNLSFFFQLKIKTDNS